MMAILEAELKAPTPARRLAPETWRPIYLLLALVLVDTVWATATGLHFEVSLTSALVVVLLAGISVAYGWTGRSEALSKIAYFAALWIVYSAAVVVFCYLMAASHRPLLDASFVSFDAALGFHWMRWFEYFQAHPAFNLLMLVAYGSMVPQLLASIVYFGLRHRRDRGFELWWLATITVLVTASLSRLFPAAGTFAYFDVAPGAAIHLAHFMALRDGSITRFAIEEMQGIVTFPSYHTVFAILLIHAYRGLGPAFVVTLVLNLLMLLSTPVLGGHHLTDMIGGAVVAFGVIAAMGLIGRVRRVDGP
jgi:membrane-associated phospholipid phosphatase